MARNALRAGAMLEGSLLLGLACTSILGDFELTGAAGTGGGTSTSTSGGGIGRAPTTTTTTTTTSSSGGGGAGGGVVCMPGTGDCDGNPTTGCETDLMTDSD